jgi:uncharacterized protein (TIGR02270 family)
MATAPTRVVPVVISQHAEMAAHLQGVRAGHVHAPHVKLLNLLRIDQRIAAHLDGLTVSGETGASMSLRALSGPDPGAMFAVAVGAIERRDQAALARLHALAGAAPEVRSGLIAAFGWVDRGALQGIVARNLSSDDPVTRLTAVAACALHRVDPGLVSARRILDASPLVRARALRTAGEIGCVDVRASCEAALRDEDPEVFFWAAWSMVLLGNRDVALDALTRAGQSAGANRSRAFRLSLQAMPISDAHRVLKHLATDPDQLRWLIRGAGIVGDPIYVPWLIGHMEQNETARLAGEAVSLITGLDLALLDLERKPPEDFESGPNDDPADPNVDMDQDDGLPWPDPIKIKAWWAENGNRFQSGSRYFMGAPVTRDHCIAVLRSGYQRQRILAAHYLCLLQPGTPLFNTSAPAWHQQQLLAEMA